MGGGGWLLFWLKHPLFESSPCALHSRCLGGGHYNFKLQSGGGGSKVLLTKEKRWTKCIDFATTVRKWLPLLPVLRMRTSRQRKLRLIQHFCPLYFTMQQDCCCYWDAAKHVGMTCMLVLPVSVHHKWNCSYLQLTIREVKLCALKIYNRSNVRNAVAAACVTWHTGYMALCMPIWYFMSCMNMYINRFFLSLDLFVPGKKKKRIWIWFSIFLKVK